jgi:hypothetical protein
MNKKGMNPLWTVVSLVVSCLVIFVLFFGAVEMAGNPAKKNKMYLAKDTALTTDAMMATMQESYVTLSYPNTLREFNVKADRNFIMVSPEATPDKGILYRYTQNALYDPLVEVVRADSIVFSKTTRKVALHALDFSFSAPGGVIDTKADFTTQRIVITGSTLTTDLSAPLAQTLRVEGFQVVEGTGDVAFVIDRTAESQVIITYAGKDPVEEKKALKLATYLKNEFSKTTPAQVTAGTAQQGLTITLQVPHGFSQTDFSQYVSVALRGYYS